MKILIAVDLSELTPKVVDYAKELAEATSAQCWIMHVAPPNPAFVGYEAGPQSERDQRADEFHERHREVEDLAEIVSARGIECTGLLIQGPTVDTIIEEARSIEADLIVLGSHGKGWAKRALFGSVSEAVLRQSDTPILVVPTSEGP